jgi:hypothetical protein
MRLLEECVPIWACLCGAVIPVNQVISTGASPETRAAPSLAAQLDEILDVVGLQEHAWQVRLRHPELPAL